MGMKRENSLHDELTGSILESTIRVQDVLGVGLYEKPYKVCLAHDLRRKGNRVMTEVVLDITFEGLLIPDAYKIDLLVNDKDGGIQRLVRTRK
jgi:GxxExxY protein